MSSIWSAIDISGTGTSVDQTWLDTIGSNVANMNDAVTPGKPVYQAQYVVAAERVVPGPAGSPGIAEGVQVDAIELGPAAGQTIHDPSNPLANSQGDVTYPVVNLGTEMTDLAQAQMSYQANAEVMSHAKSAYASILNIKA